MVKYYNDFVSSWQKYGVAHESNKDFNIDVRLDKLFDRLTDGQTDMGETTLCSYSFDEF